MTHTPGPWHIAQDEGTGLHEVHSSKHELVADLVGRADARLIAAAPEMLEALEEGVRLLWLASDNILSSEFDKLPYVVKTRAIIKKARGEG